MLCHDQIPSHARGIVSLIDPSRLNEARVISIVITIGDAENFLSKWGFSVGGEGTLGFCNAPNRRRECPFSRG
jgi:hypothetical protein